MTPLAAYALLFVAVGIGFIFVHLMAGKMIRPHNPNASKGTIYECGEPTIGSAWIQFDLRFYVVALLFVIFDVEVAFFFPWAEVFGKANAVASANQLSDAEGYHQTAERAAELLSPQVREEHARQIEQLRQITPQNVVRLHELRQQKENATNHRLEAEEEAELEPLDNLERLATQTRSRDANSAGSPCWRSPSSSASCWWDSPTCGVAAISPGSAAWPPSVPERSQGRRWFDNPRRWPAPPRIRDHSPGSE